MAIRIVRNEAGNCINFFGSSNPTYWNACLSGQVDSTDANAVNVINDIITAQTGQTEYEFFRIPYTEFTDADGNGFADAQTAADYITEKANVVGLSGEGIDLIGETVCFSLDATSTSIMLDNGYAFGVNTIKAIPDADGTIHIVSNDGNDDITHFYDLEVGNACINGETISGGLNDVTNALNELFTVGAFESVVISDPFSTMVADVDGVDIAGETLIGNGIDPLGDDVYAASSNGSLNGYLSDDVIDQAGEYFTFDIRNESQIGFGLVHTQDSFDDGYYSGSATYANPTTFGTSNSAHYGFQFSHWFHPTPNGSWTNYGANTSYVMGNAWHGANTHFEARDEWLAGDPIKIKVGIDENGFIAISSLADDGATWKLHARTAYSVVEGAEFRLGIKMGDTTARVYTKPKVHLLEPSAPTMNFRYIESPDGVFQYPLFATEDEANYYDSENGGSGASHTHVYADDPTNTTWYMPETNAVHNGTSAPLFDLTLGQSAAYTEITSLTNSDLAPPAFSDTTITIDELSTINYQLSPVDVGYVTTVGNAYGWTVVDGTTLSGTAPEVTGYNDVNPSDTTTVTVYRTNSYGTSQGTLTVNITNLTAPPVTSITGTTHEGGTALIDSDTMDDGSVISIDEQVGVGQRFVIEKEWVDTYVLPKITSGTGAKAVFIGFPSNSANYSTVGFEDFFIGWQFYSDDTTRANNNWRLRTISNGAINANVGIGGQTSGLYDYVIENQGTDIVYGGLVESQGNNPSTYVYATSSQDSTWKYTGGLSGVTSEARDIIIATSGTDMDIDLQYFAEYSQPVAPTSLTAFTKALDFSGGSEFAKQVNNSVYGQPVRMGGIGVAASANTTSGYTSSSINARPWATAIIFKYDGNNTNQHIWNQGEGAGTTDDNIYLRLDASGYLYFGWGRQGDLNECRLIYLGLGSNVNHWHGIYIAHDGTRLSGASATAANLAAAFDIRWFTTNSTGGTWGTWLDNKSTTANWITTGGRMDRGVTGDFTIGGRGSNRTFHGKVASMVVTSLRVGQPMPDNTEIESMMNDPKQWLQDYRVGQTVRNTHSYTNSSWGGSGVVSSGYGNTQIWLMGDGSSDSYANGIRNEVAPNDQNYTKLQLNSMVSNDIQTISINGLT